MGLQEFKSATTTLPVDKDAEFETNLIELMPFLRAFALSLSRKGEIAEDLVQIALTKAWQGRRSFEPGSNLKAWVFTILRHEYYSHNRRAWRQVPWDPQMVESIPAVANEHQWAVELSDTASAMKKLPDTQRAALILVAVGGFSYEDAATLSRAPVGTVKSRVGRARRRLQEILDDQTPLPTRSRLVHSEAMNDIFAQLFHLSRGDAQRAVAA
jgi:RNA polymerase sigma-70 factor (ECF subfamily)